MLHVTINGQPREIEGSGTILSVCASLGIEIPTLCHDPRLKPWGGCRLCIVHVEGLHKPVTACNAPVETGMVIHTHTPEIENLRRTLLELLARDYPSEAISAAPQKQFHRWLTHYAIPLPSGGLAPPVDSTHPYIHADPSRCIICYRCARICEELQGQFVWRGWNRGPATQLRPATGETLLQSECVSCGACVDSCPTGALEDHSVLGSGAPERWTRTTCPYCGTGCEMLVGTRGGQITQIKPALDAPVNKGHLCVKGRYASGFNNAPDRVTNPMIRQNGQWQTVSWPEAVEFVATRLQRLKRGPGSIGMLGSARGTNEENYLAQKFARVALGTNNIDCCARVCHAPTAAGMKATLGTGAATNSFDDIEKARLIMVCGCNPTENHPVVGARIKQAVLKGAKLIVIDPRAIELAHYADLHLQLRPGTNIPLLNALAHVIVQERLVDETALAERVSDFDEFRASIKSSTPETAAALSGVPEDLIRLAARLYATEKPAICFHGLGVTEHSQGTEGVICLVNLALLTGNFGKPGSGVNPLRGQNNVQGSAHMGCDPANLTGSLPLEQGRALFEKTWGVPLPRSRGLNLMEMIDAADVGSLTALWAIGYDVAFTNPDAHRTKAALAKLDLVIVQDLFMNELAREFGTVFLPAASPFEKEGTYMNSERRVQRVRQVVDPPGNCKPDWQIICDVARAMGFAPQFGFDSPEAVWNEIRSLWPAGAGMSYARLDHCGLQWPCPNEEHPGTEILHTNTFSHGPRAGLKQVGFRASAERTDSDFPLLLNTGRTLFQFNAGTMTMRTPNARLRPHDLLDISPADADALHLNDHEEIRIQSRYGEARLPIRINSAIRPGELFATFHSLAAGLNHLTGPYRDAVTGTPEYKLVAVRLEKLTPTGQLKPSATAPAH